MVTGHAGRILCDGTTIGIGSLPHRDVTAGVEFALRVTGVPTIPSLPRRSPAEGLTVQGLLGIEGVTVGQYGSVGFDVTAVDPSAPVVTDVQHDAFGTFRAFLAAAPGRVSAVKWQLVGPVTLGMALIRGGVPLDTAFEVAVRAVRSHLVHLLDAVDAALPGVDQVVFVDEPDLADLSDDADDAFPIAPDTAADLVSGALAAVETRAVSGLHVCGEPDWATLIATGPQILSVPVRASVVHAAGHLARYLDTGGVVAWGAVSTDGPISTTVERPWRQLSDLWCQLVERGCDQVKLRRQSLVSPECGLGMHTPAVAERVFRVNDELGGRVRDQATASRFVLGA